MRRTQDLPSIGAHRAGRHLPRLAVYMLTVVALLGVWGCGPGGGGDTATATEKLTVERDTLKAWLDLAGTDHPYFVLDAPAGQLRLMLHDATLRDYTVLEQTERLPRVAFIRIGSSANPRGRAWTGGVVDPAPRHAQREIVPTNDDTDANGAADAKADEAKAPEPVMPPLPEEAVPAPDRYTIRFAGGFSLEVRTPGLPVGGSFSERAEVLTGRGTPGLSIVVPEAEAGALYRSLGKDVALVVL